MHATIEDGIRGIKLERTPGLSMVLDTPKGRGVFASFDISAKTVIEVSPALVLDPKEQEAIRATQLDHYTYNWPYRDEQTGKTMSTQAVVFGLGSMFNHSSYEQNVYWERDLENRCITYRALRNIEAGEELCINYGRLWFVDFEADHSNDNDEQGLEALSRIDLE